MRMRKVLFLIYERLRDWLAPDIRYSQSIYEDVLREQIPPDCLWLDLGCGHQLLPPWRAEQEQELIARGCVVGLDFDPGSLSKHRSIKRLVRGNISQLPFADGTFDVITSNMVFEHLDDPAAQVQEIARALKPGGCLIFHTPNMWGYTTVMSRVIPESLKAWLIKLLENRDEDDVFRTYYRINSPKTITRMARSNGLETEHIRMIVTDAQFAVIPPVAFLELLWLRLLMLPGLRALRPNIIARLRKPAGAVKSGKRSTPDRGPAKRLPRRSAIPVREPPASGPA